MPDQLRITDYRLNKYLEACDDPRTEAEIEHDLANADEADVEKYIRDEERDEQDLRLWMKGEDV